MRGGHCRSLDCSELRLFDFLAVVVVVVVASFVSLTVSFTISLIISFFVSFFVPESTLSLLRGLIAASLNSAFFPRVICVKGSIAGTGFVCFLSKEGIERGKDLEDLASRMRGLLGLVGPGGDELRELFGDLLCDARRRDELLGDAAARP